MESLESSRQDPGAGEPGRDPEVAYEHEGVTIADTPGRYSHPTSHAFHFQVDEVVAHGQSPELLSDTLGGARTEGFLAFEGMGLDLVEAELQLPLEVGLGPGEPVTVPALALDLMEDTVGDEASVDDGERGIRQVVPCPTGMNPESWADPPAKETLVIDA